MPSGDAFWFSVPLTGSTWIATVLPRHQPIAAPNAVPTTSSPQPSGVGGCPISEATTTTT